MSNYHLSLSITKSLWDDMIGVALPLQVADGAFDLGKNLYNGMKQLGVKERVSYLLEDKANSERVNKAKQRIRGAWKRRKPQVYQNLNKLLRIEGNWEVSVDQEGTEFRYGKQKIGVDAQVKANASGKIHFLKENISVPFTIEKRLGASCALGDIRFDGDKNAVVGSVQDPMLNLGEHVLLRLLSEVSGQLLQQQTNRFSDVPLIPKDKLDEMVMPAGGPLKMTMSIADVGIVVDEDTLQLQIKFGFANKQITEKSE